MDLQVLLQKRTNLIEKQEGILKGLAGEGRGLNESEQKEFDDLQAQIKGLDSTIEAAKQVAENTANSSAPAAPAVHIGKVKETAEDNCGFKSLGEFAYAVRFGDKSGRLDEIKEMTMGDNASGGVMVPPQFRDELLQMKAEGSLVRPMATVIPAGDPPDSELTIPALDQGANGATAGVEITWIAEGEEKPPTQGKFKSIILKPQEIAGTTVVTDTLLRNWSAATVIIGNLLRQALVQAEDAAFLKGNGVGKPTGILDLSNTGAIRVDRATVTQISHSDLLIMLSKLSVESVGKAKWVAHQTTLPAIMGLKDEAGNLLYNAGDVTRGIQPSLLGLPISFTGKTAPLGTVGDLMLVDFSYYLIKDGSGPYLGASEHVHFTSNKTVFKIFELVDAKPWVTAPLTLEDGVTQVSPYVILK